MLEGCIHGVAKVKRGVDERAVEIKDQKARWNTGHRVKCIARRCRAAGLLLRWRSCRWKEALDRPQVRWPILQTGSDEAQWIYCSPTPMVGASDVHYGIVRM